MSFSLYSVNTLMCLFAFGLLLVDAMTVAKEQTVLVDGMIHCEHYDGNTHDPNDELVQLFASDGELLSQTRTDVNGSFILQGKKLAADAIEPYVKVLAKCEDRNVHHEQSYLANRCSFEVIEPLPQKGTYPYVGIIVYTRKAKIVCD
ncbi:transthyretin-like family domain-containing protein [Ditylenchus destructor]|uniref:Transthyretin-like family domain-containing protein n=1 Tax=Ditylenchus destructor TaxID=166010 RepID=A0AAD4QXI4_9BILA|nr:transthyretin-like family domain-containing protein [Ditylenchus destructor]